MTLFAPPTVPVDYLMIMIPGRPVGAARPRVVRLKNGHSHTFMPDSSTKWEAMALELLRTKWNGRAPLDEPLNLKVVAVCERPLKLRRRKDPQSRLPAVCKPDGDNVLKLCQDALVKARVITDDTRVVRASVMKVYQAIDRDDPPAVYLGLRQFIVERWWGKQ